MIDNLRRAEKRLGRRCKIYGDLAGPKLRTGSINQAGSVVKVRPKRNFRGEVTMPASVLFIPAGYALSLSSLPSADACIPVNGDLLQQALIGDSIELVDARGSRRTLQIVSIYGPLCCAESFKTVYFESQVSLRRLRDGQEQASGTIGKLPETILPIRLVRGDKLILTCQQMPGRDVVYDDKQEVMLPAQISCTLPEAFTFVQADERIWLDDGKIGGHVIANDGRYITVEITHADPRGSRLLPEKGINLPDTDLHMPALTDKDIEDLAFLAQHADLVGLSFLHSARDVAELQEHLQRLGGRQLGVVLKIENAGAFANLPRILLAGLHAPPVGIMVARGDLAVELGFERLSEVQEEILWLCEAAHVPVIWATQVLETMTKTGAPSRAEISDAVMSGRAECVMLNKGPYIVDTLRLLNGVLERMESHQSKKRTMLRRLSVSNLE
jgi:pyruvate kinase